MRGTDQGSGGGTDCYCGEGLTVDMGERLLISVDQTLMWGDWLLMWGAWLLMLED